MKRALAFLALLIGGFPLHAQSVILKSGETIAFQNARRSGSDFILTIEVPNPVAGQPAGTAQVTHPMADLVRVEAAEPAVLKEAPKLIAQGNASRALSELEPHLNFFASFGEAPGSHWADLAVLKSYALLNLGQDKAAATLAAELAKSPNAETVRSGQAIQAALLVKQNECAKAAELCATLIKESQNSSTQASASITMGLCHLADQKWEDALMCFLEVPVFHPDEKLFGPLSELGAARAYAGLQDFDRSIEAFSEVIKTRAGTPEAKLAQTELPAVKHRRQVLEDAKK